MIAVTNGYEGLIKIGQVLPDVIIVDLLMPKMNGFQMIDALKALPDLKHCSVTVIARLKDDEMKEKGGLPEDVYFVTKPVSFEKLELLIRESQHKSCLE